MFSARSSLMAAHATMTQQQRNGFCAVCAGMLQEGQLVDEFSQSVELVDKRVSQIIAGAQSL